MHCLTSSLPAYACHVTWTWSCDMLFNNGGIVFSTEVLEEEDELLLQLHPLFNWLEEIQQLVC